MEEEEGETEDLVDGDDCNEKGCLGVKSDGGSDGGDKHITGVEMEIQNSSNKKAMLN